MNNLWNRIVAWILASSLHSLFSGSVLLLTVHGRKSGRAISVPVNYTEWGRRLAVTSRIERAWWRNLRPRPGALRIPVSVLLKGRWETGTGVAFSGEQSVSLVAVVEGLKSILHSHPGWAKAYGISTTAQGGLSMSDLERAAHGLVYVEIELDDPQAKRG